MNSERVYRALRDRIVRGRLAPGARLIEAELAQRLRVSRTPLRAALQRLTGEGYVLAGTGLRQTRLAVAPLTSQDALELFQMIGAIEGIAAHAAAKRALAERRTLAAELSAVNQELAHASSSKRPDHDRLVTLDAHFHQLYVDAGATGRLRALHAGVKPQAERYERLYVSLLARELGVSVKEHRRIVKAILDGRAVAARAAVEANWRNAAQRLAVVISDTGALGEW